MHHIFNTNFEWEIANNPQTGLEHSFSKIQKKFLHLAEHFRETGDTVYPEKPLPNQTINAWAPSRLVLQYAKKHKLHYTIPPWDVVCKIQSKAFAHSLSPLPGSGIIHNESELEEWLKKIPPPYVFKSFYGFAGTGHKFRPTNLIFPVLAEPWVNRTLDFSTQWTLKESTLHYLGATKLVCDEKGKYKQTVVSKDEKELFGTDYPFLQAQIAFIKERAPLLSPFFGHLGFDAFIYNNTLQPISEINARKTFGYLALHLLAKSGAPSLTTTFDKSGHFTFQ